MNFKDLFLKEQSLLSAADIGALCRMVDAVGATETNEQQSEKAPLRTMSAARAVGERVEGDIGQKLKDWHARAYHWAAAEHGDDAKENVSASAQAATTPSAPASPRKSSTSLNALKEDVESDYEALASAQADKDDNENAGSFLEIDTNSATGEPFVSFVGMDRTGLALSGGGIRSATFNLGLLQGLNQHGLLEDIDYLATVSGGGYIGGWWSAWKQRIGRHHGLEFPTVRPRIASPLLQEHPPEPDEVRHLREFSNFLVPRMGFFNVDMWYGVVAILSGVLPTLFMAVSLMGLTWALWLFCDFQLGIRGVWHTDFPASLGFVEWLRIIVPPPIFLFGLNVLVLVGFEWWWRTGSGIRRDSADLANRFCLVLSNRYRRRLHGPRRAGSS